MPYFSVIIPCLNEEKFVPHLLASLVKQTERDFEVAVVDGKSEDRTVDVCKRFTGKIPGFKVIVSEKASLPYQRNTGARATGGGWLIFVDADSVFLPYTLERMKAYTQSSKSDFFTTWSLPDSNENADALYALFQNLMVEGALFLHRPLSPGPLTIVRRDIFEKIGGYDEDRSFNEDVEFSLRAMNMGIPFQIFREALYVVSLRRLRSQGFTKVLRQYFLAALPVLLFKKPFKDLPGGYIMGGQTHIPNQKKKSQSWMRRYEQKLRGMFGNRKGIKI